MNPLNPICWMKLSLRACFVMKLFLSVAVVVCFSGVANATPIPTECQDNPNTVVCDNAVFNQFMTANALAPSEATAFRDAGGSGRITELHVYRDTHSFENLSLLTQVKKFFFRRMSSPDGFPMNPTLDTMSIEYVPLRGTLPAIPAGMKTFMIWGSSPSEIDLTGAIPPLPSGIEYFLIGPKTRMVGPLPNLLATGIIKQFMITSSNDLGVLPTPLAQSLKMLIVGPTSGQFNGPLPANLETIYLWPGMTGLYPGIPDSVIQGSLAGNFLHGVPSFWGTRINWFPMNPSARPIFTAVSPSDSTVASEFTLEGTVSDDLGVIRIGVYLNGRQISSRAEADFATGFHRFTARISLPAGTSEIRVVAIDTSGQFASYTHSYTVGGVAGLSEAPANETTSTRSGDDSNERSMKSAYDPSSQINWEWVRSRLPIPQPTISMDRRPIEN